MIERRRIWSDALLADYIRDELGFPGARQGAMVEQESVDLNQGQGEMRRWWGASGPAGSFSKRGLDGFTGRTKPIFSPRECTSHFGFSLATGEVSRERWYLLTSLSSRQCQPKELLRLFRNHWSVANSLHHVKDRSWDEDVHTLRRPGLGEIFATLVNTGLNAPAPGRMVSSPDIHAPASQDLRLPPNADHRPPLRSSSLTLQSS